MTKEQQLLSIRNRNKATKYFESIYPWFKNRKPYQYVLHHKDERLRHTDIERYIEWRIEDLEILTNEEHSKYHNKGENNPMYGKHHSEETKAKLRGRIVTEEARMKQSASTKGQHWFNNGIEEIHAYECPEGFTNGRLKKKKE